MMKINPQYKVITVITKIRGQSINAVQPTAVSYTSQPDRSSHGSFFFDNKLNRSKMTRKSSNFILDIFLSLPTFLIDAPLRL